jgi:predicted nucleic acid-binding protein
MNNIIIADTGPLIALALIDQLTILNELFEKVYITEAVLASDPNNLELHP